MNAPAMTIAASTSNAPSFHTSLAQLFEQAQIRAIEIPLIQRDYAQGRHSVQVEEIRKRFIDSMYAALESQNGIDLDFVFGDVVDGTLYPLDGQQRLTTLFLLHCYLAWHIPETKNIKQSWHAFSYSTRPGGREFCQFLTNCRPDMEQTTISEWLKDQTRYLKDQTRYLPTWKHDPTIQGMLVMLDALHQRYSNSPPERRYAHWERLIHPTHAAIRFHLLPVQAQSQDTTLYVKMNSRGRPLTDFENFKAELEALMRANPAIPKEMQVGFSHKIDTDWTDLFWSYRGKSQAIDEKFMRYFRFLAEVLAWKAGCDIDQSKTDRQALTDLAEYLLSNKAAQASTHTDWMVQALDIWIEADASGINRRRAIEPMFKQLFSRAEASATQPLRVFNFKDFDESRIGVDMLHACCEMYGTRTWTLAHTLLFYGVLCGYIASMPTEDFQQRLRLLRNLTEASRAEIRAGWPNNMPSLLAEVESVMAGGLLDDIKTFNQVQVANEQIKCRFLAAHPALQETLHQLEDHDLLRGGLTVFDLDPGQAGTIFERRATQFPLLFASPYSQVTAALLTKGHEGRGRSRNAGYRLAYLGAPQQRDPWENLFRARKGEDHPTCAPLMALLDDLAFGKTLEFVINDFLNNLAVPKDWRYYMVKYEAMRQGYLGNHVIGPGAGYAMCMLQGTSCDLRGYHFDSYLLVLTELAGLTAEQIGNDDWPRCFTGDGTDARHLKLRKSGIKIQCVDAGWQFSNLPADAQQRLVFESVVSKHPGYQIQNLLHAVQQKNGIDTEDRLALGAQLLRELTVAGL
ncbi:DUF262 domain-containing protein [Simplicispira psychrophila]|uniref:DUF262 domain-containing protein n=1 Tax=Simplicispira psychrophila TaxID=80882 RepID=UPI000488A916|nr:DUF262 domain-containing protein [Simplicispira psychrophila]